ncbi:hypothetical protein V9T40_000317 [Parthenolecanium corni]|uniref:Uncharacterized protein n=1 Tax=Parthenolecanium corni TaxID=536013 RepID=A0AAN9Y1L7_9HEMI
MTTMDVVDNEIEKSAENCNGNGLHHEARISLLELYISSEFFLENGRGPASTRPSSATVDMLVVRPLRAQVFPIRLSGAVDEKSAETASFIRFDL